MTFLQKFLLRVLPSKWAADMEAESRSWMSQCPCGFARSIWELGGIRWKATGEPRHLLLCPRCGKRSWHAISRQSQAAVSPQTK